MIDRKKIAEKLRKIAEDCAISGSIAVNKTNAALYAAADELDPPEPQPEPAKEQFEVGDWVEFNPGSNPHQVRIVKVDGEKLHYIDEKGYQTHIYISAITRKLKPSEVIVNIGCLSGTVRQCGDKEEEVFALRTKNNAAIIPVAMLDTATREMVERLLKAQEVNNG